MAYLEKAIQSILDQTYDNFEIIIIDDGSSDDSSSVIRSFSDHRIRFYDNKKNKGLAATLNRAIRLSKGEYLARQDVDDVSLPQRFEKQVAFMETHPDCGMVGTWASVEAVDKNAQYIRSLPVDSLVLKFELLFDNQFIHSSVMIRKKVFEKIGLYSTDKSVSVANDYDLWCRLVREFEVSNIPEILLIYREVPNSMSRINGQHGFFKSQVITIMSENLAWITGKVKPDKDTTDFAILTCRNYQMLTSRPRFRKISRLLYEAARMLSSSQNAQPDVLRPKVCARLQSISNNYCDYIIYRYGVIFGRMIGLFYGVWKLNIRRIIPFLSRMAGINK